MRLSAPQEKLSSLLSRTQSIVERRSTRPILENLLLDAYDQNLRISATDLRISLTQTLPCSIDGEGSVSLPARKFHEIVRELPKGPVNVEVREDLWATLSAGKSVFHLPGTPPEEYPTLPAPTEEYIPFSGRLFRRMLEATLFAASSDESRIFLTGVFLTLWSREDGSRLLRMVSTDGHRLCLMDRKIDQNIENMGSGIIIPKKGLSEIKSLLETYDGDFKLMIEQGKLFAEIDNCVISITLIDSSFPNYQQVIPTDVTNWIELKRSELYNALRRVAILSDDETRTVLMETKSNEIVLTSDNPRMGDAREEMEVRYGGPPMRIAFNAHYFQEALKVFEGDILRIGVSDPLAPCLLRSPEDTDYLSVVMPMRID